MVRIIKNRSVSCPSFLMKHSKAQTKAPRETMISLLGRSTNTTSTWDWAQEYGGRGRRRKRRKRRRRGKEERALEKGMKVWWKSWVLEGSYYAFQDFSKARALFREEKGPCLVSWSETRSTLCGKTNERSFPVAWAKRQTRISIPFTGPLPHLLVSSLFAHLPTTLLLSLLFYYFLPLSFPFFCFILPYDFY